MCSMYRLPRFSSFLPKSLPLRFAVVRRTSCLGRLVTRTHLNSLGQCRDSTQFPRSVFSVERVFSSKASESTEGKGAHSVIESHDQPETQLTVGAKGICVCCLLAKA